MRAMKQGVRAGALVAVAGLGTVVSGTCPTPVNGPDVIVGQITGPSNYTAAGGLDALSLGTTSCNLGNVALHWDAFPANTHPAIGGNLYKFKVVNGSGRFEQIGMSWLKHGFTALTGSVCCTCTNPGTGSLLGTGCSDPYTSARNGTQSGLGPRWQVNAHTGAFPTGGVANPGGSSGNTYRRLEVALTDLEVSSAAVRYFGESQYVSPDDAAAGNQNNNASYNEMTVTGGPSDYTFALSGSTVRATSAIRAWAVVETGVTLTDIQVAGDGRYVVGSKATNLGNGMWHYEYAVYNMNGDRNVGSFSVPVADSVTVTNIGFHGVTYRNGDATGNTTLNTTNFSNAAWTSSRSGGVLTWSTQTQAQNQLANAIRWGTTYNFRFDANIGPANPNMLVTLGMWKTGTPDTVSGLAQVPDVPVPPCPADIDDDGDITNGLNPDGGVDINDLITFLAGFEVGDTRVDLDDDGQDPQNPDGGVDINDLLFMLMHLEQGC